MYFLLITLKVVYVLTTPTPVFAEEETVEQTRRRCKWENDDYICRGHILNASFDQLAPPTEGVEGRIADFLKLPNAARSFSLIMSKKSSASFSLSDLEGEPPVKKAKGPPRTRALPLRSTSSSKRKQVEETVEIYDFPIILDFHEAVKHGNMVMEQMVRSYNEKVQALDESNSQLAAKDQIISKDLDEMARLRREFSGQESIHAKKMEEFVAEAKNSALIVVLEARIKMTEEAAKDGFNISVWNVDAWKEKLGHLKGEDAEGTLVEFKKDGEVPPGNEGCDEKT